MTAVVYRLPSADETAWMTWAACRTADASPDLWFSEQPEDVAKAIATCGGCKVRTWCDLWAQRNGERVGVWAGVDRGAAKAKKSPEAGSELEATG